MVSCSRGDDLLVERDLVEDREAEEEERRESGTDEDRRVRGVDGVLSGELGEKSIGVMPPGARVSAISLREASENSFKICERQWGGVNGDVFLL